jgi:hypothetical protein
MHALDAAWLRTQLPNATTNAQNDVRLGAGVVFKFRQCIESLPQIQMNLALPR